MSNNKQIDDEIDKKTYLKITPRQEIELSKKITAWEKGNEYFEYGAKSRKNIYKWDRGMY